MLPSHTHSRVAELPLASVRLTDERETSPPRIAAVSPVDAAGRAVPRWLLSPGLDLLLICNLWWPIVATLVWWGGHAAHEELHFLQIYFVSTPHRWITLALVWGDARQRRHRGGTCLLIAVAAILACSTLRVLSGTFLCLAILDFLWNVWHFAAQHHGVYRLYSHRQQPTAHLSTRLERIALRGVIIFVMLRAAGWTWQSPRYEQTLAIADVGIGLVMIGLVVRSSWLSRGLRGRFWQGGFPYLASVVLLYGGLLTAVHLGRRDWVLPLATASALYHACEYLAVCGWSVQRARPDAGWLARIAPDGTSMLLGFIAVCGMVGWWLNSRYTEFWVGANLAAAFIHYAYDGLIWRSSTRGRTPAATTA